MKSITKYSLKKSHIYFFLLVVSTVISGCTTHYRIFDQHKNNLSLMIIRTNIPQGYAIKESTIKGKNGKLYSINYTAPTTDDIRNKLIVFENLFRFNQMGIFAG